MTKHELPAGVNEKKLLDKIEKIVKEAQEIFNFIIDKNLEDLKKPSYSDCDLGVIRGTVYQNCLIHFICISICHFCHVGDGDMDGIANYIFTECKNIISEQKKFRRERVN